MKGVQYKMHILDMEEMPKTWKEIDIQDIKVLEGIGKGSFGVVHKGIWNNKEVAIKKVETESEVAALQNEIQQLCRTSHENIIQLFGAYTAGPIHFLIMEYADGGSLYQLLHNPPYPPYTLAHGLSWLLQCAKAVAYLHAIEPRPIVHRDLKPPNLLLSNGCRMLKVCDFGTACDLHTVMTDNRGSAAWMAPEVFEAKQYTEKCDVYSWGIILWEVLTRRVPFLELGQAYRIMWAVHNCRRPPLIVGCPRPLETLMRRCWDQDPCKRPGMSEVLETVPPVARLLHGEEDPIQWPSPTDTGSSYVSPTMGCSSADRSTPDTSDLPSSSSSNTFVPHKQQLQQAIQKKDHVKQYQQRDASIKLNAVLEPASSGVGAPPTPLPAAFAGPPPLSPPLALIEEDDLLSGERYWEFKENQQNWLSGQNSEESRADRRAQVMQDLYNFPSPPQQPIPRPPSSLHLLPHIPEGGNSGAVFSPNATAHITVAPENLLSPCSTLRSEECMEPYSLPFPPSQVGGGSGHVSPSTPSWVPLCSFPQNHQQQLTPKARGIGGIKGLPSPLTVTVDDEERMLPTRDDVIYASCHPVYHQQQQQQQQQQCDRCMTCSSSSCTGASSVSHCSHEVPITNDPTSSSSFAPPRGSFSAVRKSPGVGSVILRQRRNLLEPGRECDEEGVLHLRRRSAEVPGLQAQHSYQGHRRSNSSGTLTSICLEEPPPSTPGECFISAKESGEQRLSVQVTHKPQGAKQAGGEGGDGGGVGGGSGDVEGGGPGEDELGRFWELLDADTQPIMPVPGCPESQHIFEEHKEMARKYLVLQQEIYNLCQRKKELSEQVAKEENQQQQMQMRYQDNIRRLQHKGEMLRSNHSRLRAQLDRIQSRGAPNPSATPLTSPALHRQNAPPSSLPSPHRSSHYTSPQYMPYLGSGGGVSGNPPPQDPYYNPPLMHHRNYHHAQPPSAVPQSSLSPSSSVGVTHQPSPVYHNPPVGGTRQYYHPSSTISSPPQSSPTYAYHHHQQQMQQRTKQAQPPRQLQPSDLPYTTNPPD